MKDLLILGIDTSGKTAAAALYEDGIILGQTSIYTVRTQSQVILPTVKRLMEDCGRELSQLSSVAVSKGPGSYTGIRIGVSAVKAISFALDIPCFGVSSLEGLAYTCGCEGIVCPVIKARKDLVYAGVYRMSGGAAQVIMEEQVISVSDLNEKLLDIGNSITLTGDGGEDFEKQFKRDGLALSPPHLRLQSGSGIILAALNKEPESCDKLNAAYLQLVKAEKDLLENSKKN